MAVTGTTTPHFTWGGCDVASVSVQAVDAEDQATGPIMWVVYGTVDRNGIRNNVIESGVTYGEEPRRATTVTGPEPLQHDQRYRVRIGVSGSTPGFGSRFDGEAGTAFFTP